MKRPLILAGCLCAFLAGCHDRPASTGRMGESLYTMQEMPHKLFSLDDSTTQVLSYIQTYEDGGRQRLALFNEPFADICIFDVETGKEIDKIHLHKEGPHAIGNDVMGFYIHTRDSIILYKYWTYLIYLVNGKGEVYRKYDLRKAVRKGVDSLNLPEVLPMSNLPVRIIGDELILQGQGQINPKPGSASDKTGVTEFYNLKDNTVRVENPYPDVYRDKDEDAAWSVSGYKMPAYDLTASGEMVLSFPADDSVRVFNPHTGATRAYFAGYSKPYPMKPFTQMTQVAEARHVYEQMQYPCIYYDRWNRLYYRIVTLPVKDWNVNDENPKRSLAVIILDKDFRKVGEYDVKEKTEVCSYSFVSPAGLHINVESDDDDYLAFMTLKSVKL